MKVVSIYEGRWLDGEKSCEQVIIDLNNLASFASIVLNRLVRLWERGEAYISKQVFVPCGLAIDSVQTNPSKRTCINKQTKKTYALSAPHIYNIPHSHLILSLLSSRDQTIQFHHQLYLRVHFHNQTNLYSCILKLIISYHMPLQYNSINPEPVSKVLLLLLFTFNYEWAGQIDTFGLGLGDLIL